MMFADLEKHEKKVHSQNGEDGVLEAIFATLGVTNRFFVEFGCADATECNTACLLEQGWNGLLMDGDGISRNPRAIVRKEFMTAENINSLFKKYDVPETFDLLSLDIDGNDYWVWKALEYRPRVIVIEYNAHVPAEESKTIIYDPAFRWSGTDYFGASLRALKELGDDKGYTVIYCDRAGVNAFFVATELLPSSFVPMPLEKIYRPPNFFNVGMRHPPDGSRIMLDPSCCPVPPGCSSRLGFNGRKAVSTSRGFYLARVDHALNTLGIKPIVKGFHWLSSRLQK